MFHLALFIIMLRQYEIKHLSYRRHALKNPEGLGAGPQEFKRRRKFKIPPLDLLLDGRSPPAPLPGSTGARGARFTLQYLSVA